MYLREKKRVVNRITVSGIEIEVTKKSIKNLYVKVSKRSGKVRVSCPRRISERELLKFIITRLDWIKTKINEAEELPNPRNPEYKNDETHLFAGKEYKLNVIEEKKKTGVEIKDGVIELTVKPGSTKEQREKVLENYYRDYLKASVPELVAKWEKKMKVKVKESRIKKMKTRWGSCNVRAKRIWISLELAKKSPGCLESVVVHEMVHLLERLHNKRFYKLMDKFFPEWRKFENELKTAVD